MEEFLHKTYYDLGHVAGYGNVKKLRQAAIEAGYTDASYSKVRKWLLRQEVYALTKPVRRHIDRGSVVVGGLNHQMSADLIDWSKDGDANDGYRYALVVMDIFSRFACTEKLKTKKTAEVSKALGKIFRQQRKPKYLFLTDAGQEFCGKEAKKLYKSLNITHIVSRNEVKAAHIERLIKTIRGKINKYLLERQSKTWIHALKPVTDVYNKTVHRMTSFAPRDVTEDNEAYVRIRQYQIKHKKKSKKDKKDTAEPAVKRPKKTKYKVGQLVRISRLKGAFSREYDLKWSGELFRIRKIYWRDENTPIFLLNDYANEPILGTFYQSEITAGEEPELYKIEEIVATRGRGKNKRHLVKWLYWGSKFNSEVPHSAIKHLPGSSKK